MIDLAELETKARAATHGQWNVEPHGSTRALYAGRNNERHGLRLLNLDDGDRNIAANAAYIAAAQPRVVLELIERVRAAEVKAGEPVALETCPSCNGSGLQLNSAGEPDDCRECKGDTVVCAAPPNVSALQERVRVLEEAVRAALAVIVTTGPTQTHDHFGDRKLLNSTVAQVAGVLNAALGDSNG